MKYLTKKKFILLFSIIFLLIFIHKNVLAIPIGTILYKTSENGRMFGYNDFEFSMIPGQIYPGGAAIYMGTTRGTPIIVESDHSGVRIIPAAYFVDLDKGEKFVGAKIPNKMHYNKEFLEKWKGNIIYQVEGKESFDFTYSTQKGPSDGEWTSAGFVEKMFESADRQTLTYHVKPDWTYDTNYYSIDITPDGFNNETTINDLGDVFSQNKEFSKIHKIGGGDFWEKFTLKEIKNFTNLLGQAGDGLIKVIETNIFGKSYQGERYFFFPYTQFIQPTLKDVKVDIVVASHGKSELPGALSQIEINTKASKMFMLRFAKEFGSEIVKKFALKNLGLGRIIAVFKNIIENADLLNEGLTLATDREVNLSDNSVLKNISAKSKEITAALSSIEDSVQYADAKLRESEELSDRTSIFSKKQNEIEENIEELKEEIDVVSEPLTENTDSEVKQYGELKEFVPEIKKIELSNEADVEEINKDNEEETKKLEEQEQIEPKQELTEKETEIEEEIVKEEPPGEITFKEGDIIISEFVSDPGSGAAEWIELYNKTNQSINLNEWGVEDNNSKSKNLKDLILSPYSYIVLNQSQDFNFYLNNSGDIIKLKYKEGLIDKVCYGDFDDGDINDNAPGAIKGQFLARENNQDTNYDKNDWFITISPTPGLENRITSPLSAVQNIINETQTSSSGNGPSYQGYASQDVIINEIMYNPGGSDSGHEWIEIYNPNNSTVDLANWKFYENETNHKLTLIKGSESLSGNSYAIIADDTDQFLIDYPNFNGKVFKSSFSLNNTSETIIIKDGQGNVIDQINYSNEWGGNGNGKTIEKKSNGVWEETSNEKGTPGEQNSSPFNNIEISLQQDIEPSYSVGDVVINEFVARPNEGESEWIELYNTTNKQIDLDNWSIEDNTGNKKSLNNLIIDAKFWLVLEQGEDFNFSLNNSGDIIKLNHKDTVINQVCYGDFNDGNVNDNAPVAGEGISVARKIDGQNTNQDNNDFSLTVILTSGQGNVILAQESANDVQEPESELEPEPESKLEEDIIPPVVSNVSILGINYNSVTVIWETNESSDSQIEYSLSTDYGQTTILDNTLTTAHQQEINGLNFSTTYHYRVKSKDESGNQTVSGDFIFTTMEALDTTPPIAQINNQPSNPTNQITADIIIGGEDVVHFKHKLDDGIYGVETAISIHIILSELSDGEHTIYVVGKDIAGNWQEEVNATIYTWVIDTSGPISSITDLGSDIFNLSSLPTTIGGTISSDADQVEIQIQKGENSYYLDDDHIWRENQKNLWITRGVTLNKENNIWSYNIEGLLDDDSKYFIRSRAKKIFNNQNINIQASLAEVNFIFDKTSPDKIVNLAVQENKTPLDLQLSWGEINDFSGIDHYEIQYGDKTVLVTDKIHQLKGSNRARYSFRVRACDKAGNCGEFSDPKEHAIQIQSLVISEIQVSGNKEFVELYNPTNESISLSDWYLAYYSSNQNWDGSTYANPNRTIPQRLKKFPDKAVIKTKGYYLVGVYNISSPTDWQLKTEASQPYSTGQFSDDAGSVVIYSSNPEGKSAKVLQKEYVDAVAWGDIFYVKEGERGALIPEGNKSLERNLLQPDTDDNFSDFYIQNNPNPQSVKGFWLNNWGERKLLVVDNKENANNLTDYQIKVAVDYISGMNKDFSDIRFTSIDGETNLPYYREEYKENQSAVFWVKIASIPAYSEIIIYQYYNNNEAVYVGDGEDVFVWFDDFETDRHEEYAYYNAMWDNQSLVRIHNRSGEGIYYGYLSPKLKEKLGENIKNFYLKTKMKLTTNGRVDYARQGFIDYRYQDENNHWRFGLNNESGSRGLNFYKNIDGASNLLGNDSIFANIYNQWGVYEIKVYETNHQVSYKDDNTEKIWNLTSHNINRDGEIYLRGDKIDSTLNVWFDYLIIGKHTQPEPMISVKDEGYSVTSPQPRNSFNDFFNWDRRKIITVFNVTNTTSTAPLIDYAVKVEINYLEGMNKDFSDVRFTDPESNDTLDYWNESYIEDGSAVFWVKVPRIPANGSKDIYMYYKNPSAAYVGDGEDVFIWFDDFETYNQSEYNYFDAVWQPTGVVRLYYNAGENINYGYLSPKNLKIKDFYLKAGIKLTNIERTNFARQGFIDYRYQDENNYWRFGLDKQSSYDYRGINFKINENGQTTLLNYYRHESWNEWNTYELWIAENNHKVRFVDSNGEEKVLWTRIDDRLNQSGDIYLRGAKLESQENVIIDYLIIAKYKPEITVSFND